jgi:hypothetical protein
MIMDATMMRNATITAIENDQAQKQALFDMILKHNVTQIEDRIMTAGSNKRFEASFRNPEFFDNNGATPLAVKVADYFENLKYDVVQEGFWMKFSWKPK